MITVARNGNCPSLGIKDNGTKWQSNDIGKCLERPGSGTRVSQDPYLIAICCKLACLLTIQNLSSS